MHFASNTERSDRDRGRPARRNCFRARAAALLGVGMSDHIKLTWRNISTPNLRDFIGYDGEQGV